VLLDFTARQGHAAGRCLRARGAPPDANRHVTKRALLLLKRSSKCPEGQFVFMEHALTLTMLRVLGLASWLDVDER
jgi:hypothetical protein